MDRDIPRLRIRALRNLDVDGVRIEEGAEAEIRAELLPELLRIGACDDEVEEERPLGPDLTKSEGEGAGAATPGGPVPQPAQSGTLEPGAPAAAQAGDDRPSAGATGGGETAAGAAPAPSTDAPRSTGDDQAAPPVPATEGVSGGAPETSGAAARTATRGKAKAATKEG